MMRNTNTKPVLRFPEFKEDWKKETLNKVFTKKSTKNKGSRIKTVLTNSATQGVILQNDYFDKEIANQNNLEGYYIVDVDDFVYNPRISVSAPVGPLKRNKLFLGVMSPLYTVLKNLKGELGFFEYYFESKYWYKYMRSIANYGARHDRMNITSVGFQNLPVPFPSLAEQKKIAASLIQIDKRIAQLKEKKENLELYKKGITQKIFSQKLRFKDENGKDFPEWKYLNGNKLFEPISNKNHNSDLPILAISQEFGAVPREMINYHISVTEKSVESYKIVEKGDYIISLRSFQGGIEYSEYKGICSPAYIILRPKVQISDYFFKTYFKTNNYIQVDIPVILTPVPGILTPSMKFIFQGY